MSITLKCGCEAEVPDGILHDVEDWMEEQGIISLYYAGDKEMWRCNQCRTEYERRG